MKGLFLCAVILLMAMSGFTQGRSISLLKKIKGPMALPSGDTLRIGDVVELQEGSLESGNFKFVQLLNGANEPIRLANSRSAFSKQEIKFFKIQDDVQYVFTKFYCINITHAIKSGEVKSDAIVNLKPETVAKEVSSKYDDIKELKKMLDEGLLTKEEFEEQKQKILNKD